MAKSDRFTVQIDSIDGLSAAQARTLTSSINRAVTSSLAALDLRGTSKKFPDLRTQGKYIVLKAPALGRKNVSKG
jgi:hypothetical protein